jgi:cell division protein FtsX
VKLTEVADACAAELARRLLGNSTGAPTRFWHPVCRKALFGEVCDMPTMRFLSTIVVSLVILSFLSGCQSMTGRSAGQFVDDQTITASVKAKLVADKAANLTRVGVKTVNGTVYLTGSVDSAEQKARAEDLANRVNGVRSIVNDIQVSERKPSG